MDHLLLFKHTAPPLTQSDLELYLAAIQLAQQDEWQVLGMWITMTVVGVILVITATAIIYKSRKIKRRNFFIFTSCLIIMEAVTGEVLFRQQVNMIREIASLPTCSLTLIDPADPSSCDNMNTFTEIQSAF
jgi:hypothetical protein